MSSLESLFTNISELTLLDITSWDLSTANLGLLFNPFSKMIFTIIVVREEDWLTGNIRSTDAAQALWVMNQIEESLPLQHGDVIRGLENRSTGKKIAKVVRDGKDFLSVLNISYPATEHQLMSIDPRGVHRLFIRPADTAPNATRP